MTIHGRPPAGDADVGRRRRGAAALSIAVNIGLLAVKGTVGLLTGSVALLASAADSLLDLTASAFAYIGVHAASRPPDATHAYGHDKFESLSSLVQLLLLFVTVGVIGVEAVRRLGGEPAVDTPVAGIGVIVLAGVVDFLMARKLSQTAAETGGSAALEADALHFATDVWSNIAVVIGLAATAAGFPIADPVAALVVAVVVAVTAIGLLRRTTGTLADRAPDPATVRTMHEVIRGVPEVRDHHTLRARMVGRRIFVDVCVELDPDLTFQRAHDVTHEISDALHAALDAVTDVVVHAEPAGHPAHQDDAHHAHGMHALSLEDHD